MDGLKTLNQKRNFAAKSLMNLYDFQILYHEDPIGFYTYDDFENNKEKLRVKISEVEKAVGRIIETERLNVG